MPFSGIITVPLRQPLLSVTNPFPFLPDMDDDDEVIISFAGADAYIAHKRYKQNNLPAIEVVRAYKNIRQVYTAYKRVDRKVKPVPGVFPEDAKVIRRFQENPLE